MDNPTTTKDIRLPCGYLDNDGHVVRDAVIQEMTGRTQTIFGRKDIKKEPHLFYKALMRDCLKEVNGTSSISQTVLDSMLVADRDAIVLQTRRLSLGEDITLEVLCQNPECTTKIFADVNLETQVDVWELPDEDAEDSPYAIQRLQVGGTEDAPIVRPVRVWSASMPDGSLTVQMRYPTVEDQMSASDDNDVVALHVLLGRLIVSWNARGAEEVRGPVGASFLSGKPLRQIDWLENAHLANSPGPEMVKNVACEKCGTETPARLEASDFFSSRAPTRGQRSTSMQRSGTSASRTKDSPQSG